MKERDHCRIAVIGLGYVGLLLSRLFWQKNYTVRGVDTNERKIQKLLRGESYLSDLKNEELKQMVSSHSFRAGSQYDVIEKANVIVICVPTPLDRHGRPDLTHVKDAMHAALPFLRKGQLVVLESTTYPGTTEEVLLPMIEAHGLKVGEDIALAYSPERIDPGQKQYLAKIPKIVSGVTLSCQQYVRKVYKAIFEQVVSVSSPKVAEMTKLLENGQRYINISFMNELTMLCDEMGINIWEAISAAKTKPYGFTPYTPGPGIGGHCIPIDPMYLLWSAKVHGIDLQMVERSRIINTRMPEFVVQKAARHLAATGVPVEHSRILIIGVTYKKDVNDLRESPALKVMQRLMALGAEIHFYDPYIDEVNIEGKRIKRINLTANTIAKHDGALILTDHSTVPYDLIVNHIPLLLDTRHATSHLGYQTNIVLL